jgi:hypothetical protein
MPGLTDAHWHMVFAPNTLSNMLAADTGLMYANAVAEDERLCEVSRRSLYLFAAALLPRLLLMARSIWLSRSASTTFAPRRARAITCSASFRIYHSEPHASANSENFLPS